MCKIYNTKLEIKYFTIYDINNNCYNSFSIPRMNTSYTNLLRKSPKLVHKSDEC